MKIIILSLVLCSLNLFADEVTIVAVGDAEQEKDSIHIEMSASPDLKAGEKKVANSLAQIIIDDFKFYGHLFDVQKSDSKYILNLTSFLKDNKVMVDYTLLEKKDKKEVLKGEDSLWLTNERSQAHKIASIVYEKITGKPSVFETKIVFVSDRGSKRKKQIKELYIMDFDGQRKQRLTYKQSLIMAPAVSPDNSKILFSAIEEKWQKRPEGGVRKIQNLNLYVLNLKNRKSDLISSKAGINSGAVFNKEGTSIYLTLSHLKNADIYKMNLATKKLTQLTKHYSADVDPHINADESLLTFLSGRHGRAHIYTMNLTGKKTIKRISFVGKFNAAPRFSPDGSEIAFSSWVDNRFDIYRIGSDGRNLVRLTKNFGSNEEAWFSPDGEFIVFTSQKVITRKKAVQDIYIMTREGEIIKNLTKGFGKSYTPRWSN